MDYDNTIEECLDKWFSRYKPYIEYSLDIKSDNPKQQINMLVAGVSFTIFIDLQRNEIEISDNYFEEFNETNMWKILFFDCLIK